MLKNALHTPLRLLVAGAIGLIFLVMPLVSDDFCCEVGAAPDVIEQVVDVETTLDTENEACRETCGDCCHVHVFLRHVPLQGVMAVPPILQPRLILTAGASPPDGLFRPPRN